jgi:hypothetical protein
MCKYASLTRVVKTFRQVIALLAGVALTACSQGFNWREISVGATHLKIWLPCKPQEASREVDMQTNAHGNIQSFKVQISMVGCEKDSLQFAVAYLSLPQGSTQAQGTNETSLQQAWQEGSLRSLGVDPVLAGTARSGAVGGIQQGSHLSVTNEQGLYARFTWFMDAGILYQIALYVPKSAGLSSSKIAEIEDTFYASLQLK